MMHLPGSLGASRSRETLGRSQVIERSWPVVLDVCVAVLGLACFYAVVRIGRLWMGTAQPQISISQSPSALPVYAFYSVVRIGLAYLLSLFFAVGYGYVAAYSRRLEGLMIAALDILQSIPVLSFLPGVMLAMVALFPRRQIGLELGAILLIFTGQVWNMAFSFYSSLRSIPRELVEASNIYGFSRWQRLVQLELPSAAIGLVWNSIVSVAGGWFFLMACEMFELGQHDFRLPGLGSYLQTAASTGNTRAICWGLGVMVAIIVATDQLIWRPVIAWSDRFKYEQVESANRVSSPLLHLLQHSSVLHSLRAHTIDPLAERVQRITAERRAARFATRSSRVPKPQDTALQTTLRWIAIAGVGGAALYMGVHALGLLRQVDRAELRDVLVGAGATFLRVNISLVIAAAWAIPAGVAIGFHPKLARIAQPFAQIAASIPATVFFPVLLLWLLRAGSGIGVGSLVLMVLSTQWYILFNVIAGAVAIPNDLREAARLFRFTQAQRWRTLILPGIFPFLLTGLVTASGGAWNASIIAEYFRLENRTLSTTGLGATISKATEQGHFQVLLLATIVMALMVVTVNRLVWRRLYGLAETRYKLEG
jgi:NitT/TauT family transport system permease protein